MSSPVDTEPQHITLLDEHPDPNSESNSQILSSCAAGDIPALKSLFASHGITSSHPGHDWYTPGRTYPRDKSGKRLTCVYNMMVQAIKSKQPSVLSFLCETFPNRELDAVIGVAINAGDVDMVKEVCRLDPNAADGTVDDHTNVLAWACSAHSRGVPVGTAAEIVSVLLAGGADPNKEPQYTPPYANAHYAVTGGLPAETIGEFFDHGYRLDDDRMGMVKWAVSHGRRDVVEVLFERGGKLTTAVWPPFNELLLAAKESGDQEMRELVMEMYPRRAKPKQRGCAVM